MHDVGSSVSPCLQPHSCYLMHRWRASWSCGRRLSAVWRTFRGWQPSERSRPSRSSWPPTTPSSPASSLSQTPTSTMGGPPGSSAPRALEFRAAHLGALTGCLWRRGFALSLSTALSSGTLKSETERVYRPYPALSSGPILVVLLSVARLASWGSSHVRAVQVRLVQAV